MKGGECKGVRGDLVQRVLESSKLTRLGGSRGCESRITGLGRVAALDGLVRGSGAGRSCGVSAGLRPFCGAVLFLGGVGRSALGGLRLGLLGVLLQKALDLGLDLVDSIVRCWDGRIYKSA